MVRSKVKLAFINDDSARRATYRKRSKGLLKKVNELSTLCDVAACGIVYGPYAAAPEVWPSPEGAREVLTRFKRMPEYQQGVKMANQESFTRGRIKKAEEKLAKLQMETRHKELTRLMYKGMRGEATSNPNVLDLIDIVSVADEKIKEIALGMEKLRMASQSAGSEKTNKTLTGNLTQGVETSNGTEGGNPAQGSETENVINKEDQFLQGEETLNAINDGMLPQHVVMSAPMEENLHRIIEMARGKLMGENLPLGTNMIGTIREQENPSDVNVAPNYLQGNTDDLMPYPQQGFSWDEVSMQFPNTYNWSSSNPHNDKP